MSDLTDPFDFIASLLVGMLRATMIVALLPMGKKSSAGQLFKLPFSVAVGLCVASAVTIPRSSSPTLYLLATKEILLGVMLGFMISRLFIVVGAAGSLIDQQAGYTVGALFNPSLGHTAGPIETLYTTLLILLLITAGGGFYFPKMIMATYAVWPVTALTPPTGSIEVFIGGLFGAGIDQLIDMVMQLAMPILAMLMFADICVALFGRYAPDFNPLSASLAIKAALVALMLVATLDSLIGYLQRLIPWLTRVQ
jgi:type III secretory pathway component EscT